MKKHTSHLRYYLYLMIAIVAWASLPVVGKATLSMAGPVTISIFRGIFAFLFILPFALKAGFRPGMLLTKKALFYGSVAFLCNTVVMQAGLSWCSANVASILQATMPVCMLIGGVLCLGEVMTAWKAVGAVLATAGIVITCIGGTLIDENTTIVGILMAASTSVTWTIYSVHIKKYDENLPAAIIAAMTFGVGVVLTAPFCIGEILLVTGIPAFTPEMVLSLLYLGVVILGVANMAWSAGVARVDAAVSGLLFNLSPVLGMLLALLAGEVMSGLQFFGCAVVIVGIFLGFRDQRREERLHEAETTQGG